MRLFVGLELPGWAREALVAWAAPARDVRRLPAEALHVTLFFLGEREDRPREALEALPANRVRVRTAGAAWLGSALAVELEDLDGALGALHAGGFPGWAPEGRPLRPHVTVARAVRGARPALPPEPPPELEADLPAVVLWRSHTESRYEALARRMLPVSAG